MANNDSTDREEPSKCVEILVLTLKNGGNDESVCNRVIAIINKKKTNIGRKNIYYEINYLSSVRSLSGFVI